MKLKVGALPQILHSIAFITIIKANLLYFVTILRDQKLKKKIFFKIVGKIWVKELVI